MRVGDLRGLTVDVLRTTMPYMTRPTLVASAALLLLDLSSQAASALSTEEYRINLASFSSSATFVGGSDPTRVIQQAASKWRSLGGMDLNFKHVGTTSDAGCGFCQ